MSIAAFLRYRDKVYQNLKVKNQGGTVQKELFAPLNKREFVCLGVFFV